MPGFTMRVDDVFHFSDGRTVFTGAVVGRPEFIRPCLCRLFVDETVLTEIEIEGEMLVERRAGASPSRGLLSATAVELDRAAVSSGRVKVVQSE